MATNRDNHWLLLLTLSHVTKLAPMPKADTFRLGENKKIRRSALCGGFLHEAHNHAA